MKTILTIGIPASGKTTWAKQFVKDNNGYVRVSRDDFRFMLKDSDKCDDKVEILINGLMIQSIKKCLTKYNVIVDATHVKLSYINEVVNEIREHCDIDFKVFDTDFMTCCQRNSCRERVVPLDVMDKMRDNFAILKNNFKFEPIPKKIIPQKEKKHGLPDAVLVDIDGTLAIIGDRSPFEWHKVDVDTVNNVVSELTHHHSQKGRFVILVSGRDASCEEKTREWLIRNNVWFDALYMRPINDFRKDSKVKQEIYDTHIKDKYNVFCVIDDRLQVLDMWHKNGLYTFSVNQGQKEF